MVEVTGLDSYHAKLKVIESRVDAKSMALVYHEASSDEVTIKL